MPKAIQSKQTLQREDRHIYFKDRYGSNNILNKVIKDDLSIHDWYRFVLSFPPHIVREYFNFFGGDSKSVILDPFCGTGTTLVEAKKMGVNAIGVEAHPTTAFASETKTSWEIDIDKLIGQSYYIANLFSQKMKSENEYRALSDEQEKLILKNSISPRPLHKILILRDIIESMPDSILKKYELLAFAKILVSSASNLRFGPEVGVRGHKEDADVVNEWLKQIDIMAGDLKKRDLNKNSNIKVFNADSRDIKNIVKPNSVDIVITSPPYPNEKDYTRTTRLETIILGFAKNKEDLRRIKKGFVRSNTRSVYKEDSDDKFVKNISEVQRISIEIERRRVELKKTSGFERMYHRVAKLYFGGMARHFADLRTVLKPGAMLAYVVGDQASYLQVMIRTGNILGEIAESLGYEVVNIDLFRTRLATATKEQLREEVLVLRWPGEKI